MDKKIIALLAVVIAGGGGWYVFTQSEELSEQRSTNEVVVREDGRQIADVAAAEQVVSENDTATMKDKSMKADGMGGDTMMKDDAMGVDGETMMKAGAYAPYDESKLAMAEMGDVVLFFKASWCPSCRAVDSDIVANAASIPHGLTILEVDYDTATALKQRYGVTTQHTFVQVDAAGVMLKKWSGGSTLESIVEQVQ
jgi:thiol-disulfide isomerase/thioredoxin